MQEACHLSATATVRAPRQIYAPRNHITFFTGTRRFGFFFAYWIRFVCCTLRMCHCSHFYPTAFLWTLQCPSACKARIECLWVLVYCLFTWLPFSLSRVFVCIFTTVTMDSKIKKTLEWTENFPAFFAFFLFFFCQFIRCVQFAAAKMLSAAHDHYPYTSTVALALCFVWHTTLAHLQMSLFIDITYSIAVVYAHCCCCCWLLHVGCSVLVWLF